MGAFHASTADGLIRKGTTPGGETALRNGPEGDGVMSRKQSNSDAEPTYSAFSSSRPTHINRGITNLNAIAMKRMTKSTVGLRLKSWKKVEYSIREASDKKSIPWTTEPKAERSGECVSG